MVAVAVAALALLPDFRPGLVLGLARALAPGLSPSPAAGLEAGEGLAAAAVATGAVSGFRGTALHCTGNTGVDSESSRGGSG